MHSIRPFIYNWLGQWILAWIFVGLAATSSAGEKRYDNAFLLDDISDRLAGGTERHLDYTTKRAGDYSLRYDLSADSASSVEFRPGNKVSAWKIGRDATLRFWWRESHRSSESVVVEIEDAAGVVSSSKLPRAEQWSEQSVSLPSHARHAEDGLSRISRIRLRFESPGGGSIWIDDMRWEHPDGSIIGVTEKTIRQQKEEADASRGLRVAEAMKSPVTKGLREGLNRFVAELETGADLQRTNDDLVAVLTTTDKAVREELRLRDLWCLATNQTLYRIYHHFGSKGVVHPGRLRPDAEKALLAELWDRTHIKNDIALARQSTWWLEVSENHDVIAKVTNLLASQIFAREPDYSGRVLPNLGNGGGFGFWYSFLYGGADDMGPHGRANDADGRQYTSKDHVVAWTNFWKEYLIERARKGFFVEVSSPNYMEVTVTHLYDLAEMAEDAELRELASRFLDLYWLEWAQDQIGGVRGGAKTRSSNAFVVRDTMYPIIRFAMGGAAVAKSHHFSIHHHPYRLPNLVWELALDRQSLGEFAYVSRKPGESSSKHPRPLGTERSTLVDTTSRYRRESWVTPDYILGSQMDHPNAVHSHISTHARWHGMIFAGEDGRRVFPGGLDFRRGANAAPLVGRGIFRSVQNAQVIITQEARSIARETPEWLGTYSLHAEAIGLFFSPGLARLVERAGWIFIEEGNAFLAVKPIMSEYANDSFRLLRDRAGDEPVPILTGAYEWTADRTAIRLVDRYSPIIMEASRREHHASLEEFMSDVLDNPLWLERTAYPGFNIVHYRGCGESAKDIVFSAATMEIPTIGGVPVDYEVPAFLSPWLEGAYGSGVITAKK